MARYDRELVSVTLLDAVMAAVTSVAVIPTTRQKTFQIVITGIATVVVEVSNDGTTFLPLQPGIVVSGVIEDSAPWKFVRVRVLSYTSGSVTAVLCSGG